MGDELVHVCVGGQGDGGDGLGDGRGDIMRRRGASGQNCCQIAVSVAPGRSATTRMPRGRSSSRRVSVKASRPRLEPL